MSDRYTRRSELLNEAERIITQDRNKSYGEPDEDFQRIAAIASAMGFQVQDGKDHAYRNLTGSDVARFMIALKLSRLAWMPDHRDSWLDIAGYAGCGYETAALEAERSGLPQEVGPTPAAVAPRFRLDGLTALDRLRKLVGHGWDGCVVCRVNQEAIKQENGIILDFAGGS